MGSLQQLSILKGQQNKFKSNLLHRIFEDKITSGCGQKDALIYNGKPLLIFSIKT